MADGTSVGSLFYDLGIDDSKLQGQLDDADKNVKQLGDSATTSFDKFQQGAKTAAIGLGVVGTGLTLYSKNASDYTEQLVKDSKALGTEIGVSTTEASRLTAALDRMGITSDESSTAFGVFSKNIIAAGDAADGTSTTFSDMGIAVKDASGKQRDFTDILNDTADKFKAMPDGVQKTSDALSLFGRTGGKDMIKVLNLGSDGIKDLEDQADKLGLTLNIKTIGAINNLITAQKDLKEQTDALKIQVGTATAPVIEEFDKKVNTLVQSLLNTHGGMHTVVVDFLAFGGPVAGAASAILGFLANLDQAMGALKGLATGFGSIIGLLQSPWVLAFVAAGTALAIVTSHLFDQSTEADKLATAQEKLKNDTNDLKTAQDNLATAQLAQQGASLQVEQAQLDYNDAVLNYGPNSLQARTAAYNLQVAQENLKTATDNAKQALIDQNNKGKEIAQDKTLINHLNDTATAADGIKTSIDGISTAADGAVTSINKLSLKVDEKKTPGGKPIDLSPLLKRAAGGPVTGGIPYLTGEQGPELYVPSHSGTIIPADLTKQILGSQRTTRMGDTYLNIGEVNNAQDENWVIRQLDRNAQLAGMGLSAA